MELENVPIKNELHFDNYKISNFIEICNSYIKDEMPKNQFITEGSVLIFVGKNKWSSVGKIKWSSGSISHSVDKNIFETIPNEKETGADGSAENYFFVLKDPNLISYNDLLFKNVNIYPNAGYTLYFLIDNSYEIDENSVLGLFIGDELRGKTSEFILNDNRLFVTINVNLKSNDEKIQKLILYTKDVHYDSRNIPLIKDFVIGENNIHTYPNLPIVHFRTQ